MKLRISKKRVVLLLLLIAAFFLYREWYWSVSSTSEPVLIEIGKGESFKSITKNLKKRGLVRRESLFRWYAALRGLDTEVKAGRFRLDPSLSPARILAFLANPENGEISVTIPEGYSIFDIDKKLVSIGLIREGEFVAFVNNIDTQGGPSKTNLLSPSLHITHLEGFLFPDTYFVFSKNFHPIDLVDSMLKNFEKKVLEGLWREFERSNRTLSEIITVASILEKEVKTKEDFPVVAGILWKRLDHNWPLQADATLLYGQRDRILSPEELRQDSPHNTYTRRGLPETPIGNPGLETIRAALFPSASPYWFYLTTKDGKVIYAKTNDEHNENKRKFL